MFFKNEKIFLSAQKLEQKSIFKTSISILTAVRLDNILIVAGSNIIEDQLSPILLIDMDHARLITQLTAHKKNVSSLLVLDSNRFVSSAIDGTIKIWNADVSTSIDLEGHGQYVSDLLKLDDTFLSASYDGTIKEWDFSGNLVGSYLGHRDYIFSMTRIDANRFASVSGNSDNRIVIWNSIDRSQIGEISTQSISFIHSLITVSPDLLAACGDKVCLFDTQNLNCRKQFDQPFVNLGTCTISKITNTLLAVGTDRKIYFIDIEKSKVLGSSSKHSNFVSCILPIDDTEFLSCDQNGNIISNKWVPCEQELCLEDQDRYIFQ